MINFDRANRDALMQMSRFMLSILLSLTSFLVAIYSIVYSISGFGTYIIIVAAVFIAALVPLWIKIVPKAKRSIEDSIKLNEQLQKELFELYPEYKDKLH